MKYVITEALDIAREAVCWALVTASAVTITATATVLFGG